MKLNFSTISFIVLLLASCTQKQMPSLPEDLKNEITSLENHELKNAYLLDLWHKDQSRRKGQEGDIINRHGYNSEQHLEYKKSWKENDNLLFQQIKYYLEIHGYPNETFLYDELALNAFPTIIGHNHNYKMQYELLPYIYDGYKKGNCTLDDLVWILGEMYESKNNGKRYKMKNNRFRLEDEFIELTKVLNLDLEI